MAQFLLLGLFEEVTSAANALEGLRNLGVPDNRVEVMSTIPYSARVLGRRRPRHHLGLVTAFGALSGLTTALLLADWHATPVSRCMQGGQPLIPIPPSLIITFELTMLGTMWVTFFGFWLLNRFPRFGKPIYDERISDGQIGVVVEVDDSRVDRAVDVLKTNDATEVMREPWREQFDSRAWKRWLTVVGLGLAAVLVIFPLFVYDVIRIPFGTQMDDQVSVPYQGGPRLAAPAAAVPVQGPVLIADQPATQPVAADAGSLQRGQVLFNLHCALCHSEAGTGDGRLSGYFNPKPANLTSAQIQALSDQQIFLVITNGYGIMPSIREDLLPEERWDVVNWVRTLKAQ